MKNHCPSHLANKSFISEKLMLIFIQYCETKQQILEADPSLSDLSEAPNSSSSGESDEAYE